MKVKSIRVKGDSKTRQINEALDIALSKWLSENPHITVAHISSNVDFNGGDGFGEAIVVVFYKDGKK